MIIEISYCACGDNHEANSIHELDEVCPVYETQILVTSDPEQTTAVFNLRVTPGFGSPLFEIWPKKASRINASHY